jgi:flagellar hook-length control protein FliK
MEKMNVISELLTARQIPPAQDMSGASDIKKFGPDDGFAFLLKGEIKTSFNNVFENVSSSKQSDSLPVIHESQSEKIRDSDFGRHPGSEVKAEETAKSSESSGTLSAEKKEESEKTSEGKGTLAAEKKEEIKAETEKSSENNVSSVAEKKEESEKEPDSVKKKPGKSLLLSENHGQILLADHIAIKSGKSSHEDWARKLAANSDLHSAVKDSLYSVKNSKKNDSKTGSQTTDNLVKQQLDPDKWKVSSGSALSGSDFKESILNSKNSKSSSAEEMFASKLKTAAKDQTVNNLSEKNEQNSSGSSSEKGSGNRQSMNLHEGEVALKNRHPGSDEVNEHPTVNRKNNIDFADKMRNSKNQQSAENNKASAKGFSGTSEVQNPNAGQDVIRKDSLLTETNRSAAIVTKNGETITEMMNRLAVRAKINVTADGNSTAAIRLNPENLGYMTLNLKITDNKAEGKILVENPAAMKMIRDEIESLRQELKAQGIQLEQFTVTMKEMSSSDFNAFQNSSDNDQSGSFLNSDGSRGSFNGNESMESNNEGFYNLISESADTESKDLPLNGNDSLTGTEIYDSEQYKNRTSIDISL